jgi:hypothetical protein
LVNNNFKARHDNHFSLETLRAALTKEAFSALYGQTSVEIAWIATPQGRRFCLFFPNRREGPLSNRQIRAQEDEEVEAIQTRSGCSSEPPLFFWPGQDI